MPTLEQVLRQAHDELKFEFVRSSGPGGQNVNKVATAVQLRFDVTHTAALSAAARERLVHLAGRRMTADAMLVIEARRYRTQEQNRLDAVARLDALLREALRQPRRRVATRASAAARERRLQSKKKKGEIKRSRQDRSYES